MKTINGNIEVSSRSYYYLLDWNEKDEWVYIHAQYNKGSLKDLTIEEYKQLFNYATQCDLKFM